MDLIEVLPQLHVLRSPEPADLNVYVWRDGDEVTLIDAGLPGCAAAIADGLRRTGSAPEAVRRVVVTHAHEDHIGALAEIADWNRAEVMVHRDDAAVVRGLRQRDEPVLRDWERPMYEAAPTVTAEPSRVDRELADGDVVDFGGGARIIAVPGHTPGSIAIHLPAHRVLFAGDTVANYRGETMPGVFNLDSDAVAAHAAGLSALAADLVCVGHGDPLHGDALAAWRARTP